MSKYRYLLTYSSGSTTKTDEQFYPVDDNVVIKYTKEDGKYYFTKEISGSLIFRNDLKTGITDYTKLMSVTDICTSFYIEIQKQDGNRWIEEWWTGVFTRYDCKIDEDACTITVTPAKYDEYNELEAILDKEVNILYDGTEVVVELQNSVPDEGLSNYPVCFYETMTFVDTRVMPEPYAHRSGSTWTFEHESVADGYGRPWFYHDPNPGYVRLPNPLTIPDLIPVPLPPAVWPNESNVVWELYSVKYELTDDTDPANPVFRITTTMFTNFYLFWKPEDGICVTPEDTVNGGDDLTFRTDYSPNLGNLQICKYRRHPYYINNDAMFVYDVNTQTFTFTGSGAFSNKILRSGRLLRPTIEKLIEDTGLTYQSKFFNNSLNPVTGLENQLESLVLVPNSEVSIGVLTNRARRELITLKQLLNDLAAMFPVGYTIEDGKFILEHCKYFENGGSYTGAKTIGTDLTVLTNPTTKKIYITKSNKYEYNTEKLVDKEHFTHYTGDINIQTDTANTDVFIPLCNADFSQMDITYENCVQTGKSTDRSTAKVSPDWIKLMFNYDPQLRGFCLFSTRYDRDSFTWGNTTVNKSVFIINNEYSELSHTNIPNGHLTWGNLHVNYWKYNRPLPEGYMVGVKTAFTTSEKLKVQKDLSFHNCLTTFDPSKLIKTELGNGEVVEAEESLKTETIKVSLKYD